MNAQDLIDALTEQRNSALNALAMATAENVSLKRRIEECMQASSPVTDPAKSRKPHGKNI